MTQIAWIWTLIGIILGILLGLLIGFFVTKKIFTNQIKKNPPINANMIRAMYSQMGRKPSEMQIRAVMSAMRKSQS